MKETENLVKQYRLLTDWFLSVLDGVPDEDGNKTIGDNMNSLAWLAGHLLTGRYRNLIRLEVQANAYQHLDKFINQAIPPPNAIPFNASSQYPTLTQSVEEWNVYAQLLLQGISEAGSEILNKPVPFNVPVGGNTVADALYFVALHESYHIGQMSIIRKALGYGPMSLVARKR